MIRNFDDNHDDDNNDNADKHDDNNDDDNDDNVDNHDETMMMTTMSQIFTSQAPCRESSASWKRSSRSKNDLQAEDFNYFLDEAFLIIVLMILIIVVRILIIIVMRMRMRPGSMILINHIWISLEILLHPPSNLEI